MAVYTVYDPDDQTGITYKWDQATGEYYVQAGRKSKRIGYAGSESEFIQDVTESHAEFIG